MIPKMTHVHQRRFFPDPGKDTMDGIVAMGDELRVETLLEAYSFGIFPWPHSELPCLWFCPDQRGILEFADLHISRSLEKFIKKVNWEIKWNTDFEAVIRQSAQTPRAGQKGTWITEPIIRAYLDFHRAGYAHSIECYAEDELIGGVYGVYVGGVFSGESMFFKRSNASKFALLGLIEHLKTRGLTWMDIQMITPVTENLGGRYIPKNEFLRKMKLAQNKVPSLF